MSRQHSHLLGHRARVVLMLGIMVASTFSVACWEQVSAEWFPQMKRQTPIQAFEYNTLIGDGQMLTPPAGTVPVGNPYPDVAALSVQEQETLANPVSYTLESLKSGEEAYLTYCVPCHGEAGWGNGSVAGPPFGNGPFGLVLPVGGPNSVVKAFSDGHIYTTITLGRGRMPGYSRIPAKQRWDLVNYIRDLNGQGGRL